FKGSLTAKKTNLKIVPAYQPAAQTISLVITNKGAKTAEVTITNVYTGGIVGGSVLPGQSLTEAFHLKSLYCWYDLVVRVTGDASFVQHIAGHLETGKDSATDPALGGVGRAP